MVTLWSERLGQIQRLQDIHFDLARSSHKAMIMTIMIQEAKLFKVRTLALPRDAVIIKFRILLP